MLDNDPTLGTEISLEQLSQLLKASGDTLRLEILRVLERDSFGVLELCQIFDIKQSGMSHHLKVLAKAGLVTTRKEGNSVFYQRATQINSPSSLIIPAIFTELDKCPVNKLTQQNIDMVFAKRAATSLEFFSDNANPLKEQQDLIAGLDVYGERVVEFLKHAKQTDSTNNGSKPFQHILEVGPGNGEFLPTLASLGEQVTALDNSEKMLNLAREHVQSLGLNNVNFALADTTFCQQQAQAFDCAVINMVLHHTPSPQKIFKDVSKGLSDNGIVLVCDLCQHNQDWARETCGDMWLGFDPDHLTQWAKESNLSEGQSSFFALRNGFQIQIKSFYKFINKQRSKETQSHG